MNIGKAIYGILSGTTAVTDIVGTKIFPEIAEQETAVPFVVYQVQSVQPEDTHDGPSKLDEVRVEVLCYDDAYNGAADLASAVRGALDRVRGTYNGVNVESVQFNDVDFEIEYDPRRYSQVLTFTFRIKRDDIEIALGAPITGVQLSQLSDVNVSNLAEGQILKYDVSESEWVNASLPILTTGSLTQSESSGYTILSISSNPSFQSILSSGDVTVSGDILLAGASTKLIRPLDVGQAAGPLTIQSNGDLIIELDQDNNEPYKAFIVKNGGDAEVFKVDEEGNVTVNQEYVLPSSDGGTDYFLKTDGSGQLYFATLYGTSGNTGGSPPPAIDTLVELLDTNISNLQDNQIIRYDSASGKWLNEDFQALPAGGTTGQALVKASGTDYDVQWADIAIDVQYHQRYDTEAAALRSGATETVELYYTAQADGDGLSESASSDTPTSGYDIQRKLYYAEKAQADPDTSADWTQFTAIADNTTFNNAKAALLAYLKERTGGTVPISLKMTWEEVAQAPSFTGLLNESYGSGAEAAYSTRRLNGNVTDCMVIRRASDSTTTTIGFDGSGNIDESAIETFCTGTTCTVYQWLDQSGNGNDATAAASGNEPTIYTGGALVKQDGRVAVDFDGVNDIFTLPITLDNTVYYNNFVVCTPTGSDDGVLNLTNGTDVASISYGRTAGQVHASTRLGATTIQKSGAHTISTRGLFSSNHDFSPQVVDLYIDGVQQNGTLAGRVGLGDSVIGGQSLGSRTFEGQMQEVIVYDSDKSTDRTSIESNIGGYFTQNTPLLDTYSGAAAAYSLRLLDSTYTGALVEVYNGSSYADIGANVFGELDTVALAAHCGSNDGFVSKWYDQSGNTNTAAQTTTANMPKIYDGATASVILSNGKPSFGEPAGGTRYLRKTISTDNLNTSNEFTCISVHEDKGNTGRLILGNTAAFPSWEVRRWSDDRAYTPTYNQGGTSITNAQVIAFLNRSGNSVKSYQNNNAAINTTDTATISTATITSFPINQMRYNVYLQEYIIWPSDLISSRADIQDNLNNFYSAY